MPREQLKLWGIDGAGREVSAGARIVYFMESGDFMKVGFTTRDADTRKRELDTGNPDGLTLYGSIVVSDDENDHDIQATLMPFHYRNEWFRKTPEFLTAVHRLMVQRGTAPVRGVMFVEWPIIRISPAGVKMNPKHGHDWLLGNVCDGPECLRCAGDTFYGFGTRPQENQPWRGVVTCRCSTLIDLSITHSILAWNQTAPDGIVCPESRWERWQRHLRNGWASDGSQRDPC